MGRDMKNGAKDVRGNVMMIAALCLLPICVLVGLSVDSSRMTAAKVDLQAATDAALLNAAVTYFYNTSIPVTERQTLSRNAGAANFDESIGKTARSLNVPTINLEFLDDGGIRATGRGGIDLVFGGFIGESSKTLTATAEVSGGQGGRKLEIALVLDNSSSMFTDDRMQKMRGAARVFANRMFDTMGEDDVRISVVPWSATVNIRTEAILAPDNAQYLTLMPTEAAGSRRNPKATSGSPWSHTLNPFTGSAITTRAQADAVFAPTEWRGCIRAAAGERSVNASGNVTTALTDEFPSADWPLGLVPPSLEQGYYYTVVSCGPSGGGGGGTPPPSGTQASVSPDFAIPTGRDDGVQTEQARQGMCYQHNPLNDRLRTMQWFDYGRRNAYFPKSVMTYEYDTATDSQVATAVTACLGDPNEFKYWASGGVDCPFPPTLNELTTWSPPLPGFLPWDEHKPIAGPNLNCPTAILPLSGNRRQVIEKLDHMYPVPGGTQTDVGLMWGLRTLSDRAEWATFFNQPTGATIAPFNSSDTLKVVILLTDGVNEAPIDFEGYYGCTQEYREQPYDVGDPEDFDDAVGCWRSPDVATLDKASLDALTLDACTQMKDVYGLRLFTIAVDINDASAVDLLRACATTSDDFYNITEDDIGMAFSEILTQVIHIRK